MMPNSFAYVVLVIWPFVAVCLFARLPLGLATIWTILGAYMLLPVDTQIKFEMVPAFDKSSIPNLTALICCVALTGWFPNIFRGFGLIGILILGVIAGPFISSLLNTDPIYMGAAFRPGVGAYDGLSASIAAFVSIIPFFLGRQFLRGPKDNADILRVLVIAGLAYSLPMLFEIRMSPQLHYWIYGYFPTSFAQQARDGGFRPVVFMGHGLLVAFFTMTATVAAAALWRTQTHVARMAPGPITAFLGSVLVLCKTMNALIYSAILLPLVRWANPRLQLGVASILVLVALAYPMLRTADLIPTTFFLEAAGTVSADREASLKTRFDQERQLLDYALQRPWFGWGRFARNRILDPKTGEDISTTDGYWVETVGSCGLVGFLAQFGLLALVVLRAVMALKFTSNVRDREYLAALGLIVAVNVFDLLPNNTISPWTWLLVGALLGRAEALRSMAGRRVPTGGSQHRLQIKTVSFANMQKTRRRKLRQSQPG